MKSQKSSKKVSSAKKATLTSRQASSPSTAGKRSLSVLSIGSASSGVSTRRHALVHTISRKISTSRSYSITQHSTSKAPVASRRKMISPSPVTTSERNLHLHEYQSKTLLHDNNVRIQKSYVATNKAEAFQSAQDLESSGIKKVVVKSQIHAGGRGKGYFKETGYQGGVKIATTPEETANYAQEMLGKHLVTKQTGPEGQLVSKVLIEEGIDIVAEKYFAILMDRSYKGPVLMASPFGGMNIEEVAAKDPKAVKMIPVDITHGITDAQATEAAEFLGFKDKVLSDAVTQIRNLYQVFIKHDSTQVEINPLVLASDDKVYAVDAKINFDDNAFFRQKDIFAQRDATMEDPRDVAAAKFDLNYVGLDGNIGCMVNGAGLAMATMDIIKLRGGWPANFLDVGGGATAKQVEEAFKILTADPKVEAILVNIFGGIMKCDVIAEGIITAARNLELKVPLIVRLEGTNVQKGVDMLNNSGLAIISASDLDDAAQKAVAAVGITPVSPSVH